MSDFKGSFCSSIGARTALLTIFAARVMAAGSAAAADAPTNAVAANAIGGAAEQSSAKAEIDYNSVGMKLVLIPAGQFLMGAKEDPKETLKRFPYADPKRLEGELPRHRVSITKPFYMGQYEVTLGQFLTFYHASGYKTDIERDGKPSWGYQKGQLVESNAFRPWAPGWEVSNDYPVVYVSWNDAVAFCNWLSKKEGKTYRLPTEAEWEYACRGRMDTRYSFGDEPEDLTFQANAADDDHKLISPKATMASVDANGKKKDISTPFPFLKNHDGYTWTAPVGKFLPNAFGLYDMHGNVLEWCSDWYDPHYYEHASASDPRGPATGSLHVLRGGGFNYAPLSLRSADRQSDAPSHRSCSYGFRVVCDR